MNSKEAATLWGPFTNEKSSEASKLNPPPLPSPPPWRKFGSDTDNPPLNYEVPDMNQKDERRGQTFCLPRSDGKLTEEGEKLRLAVNAAIHLRRPLLVTGTPGSGKTSLAYAIANELGLGRVLVWPITPRTEIVEGLYRYDALDRLREAQISPGQSSTGPSSTAAKFITLGPLGTAFLPLKRPRVLLIDEIDKSDLQLPNELLNLFEEGRFEIPQLRREAREASNQLEDSGDPQVDTDDPDRKASIRAGRVECREFPIVVMTSNRERDFPMAFNRRCIRIEMPIPDTAKTLRDVVESHLRQEGGNDKDMKAQIEMFLTSLEGGSTLATDQLLNALYLRGGYDGEQRPKEDELEMLNQILLKPLNEVR
jgi:MoxR-like ATPase